MQIRTPAVAGMFYPGEKDKLKKTIHECFLHPFGTGSISPSSKKTKIYGVICPHAGYVYSGPIASHSMHAISGDEKDLFIIIGPNHWGIGATIASMKDCTWQTPLGNVEVDTKAAEELSQFEKVIDLDFYSHTREHSLEVQIPMLQQVFKNKFKILPIIMINQEQDTATKVGAAVAKIMKKYNSIVIGSSDFTHYEQNDFAHKQDMALIEPILKLDVDRFYKVLLEKQVTACGYGAIASTMIACKQMGASKGELLKYATSGDVSGDKTSVVGYGSIVFT